MTLQHLRCCGLLIERLGQLARTLRSASNSRTFSIAISAWSAKVDTSPICLSLNGRTMARVRTMTPIATPSRSSGTPRIVR